MGQVLWLLLFLMLVCLFGFYLWFIKDDIINACASARPFNGHCGESGDKGPAGPLPISAPLLTVGFQSLHGWMVRYLKIKRTLRSAKAETIDTSGHWSLYGVIVTP